MKKTLCLFCNDSFRFAHLRFAQMSSAPLEIKWIERGGFFFLESFLAFQMVLRVILWFMKLFLRLSKTASEMVFSTRTKIAFLKFQGVVVNMRTRQQQHCQEKWSWKLHPWDVKEIKWKATGKMVQMFYYENHGKCCKTLWKHDGKKLKVSHKL